MRSWTAADLPGRCPRCWILQKHCLCAELPSLVSNVSILIVRHHFETRKSTNTARIAELCLANCRIVEYTDSPEQVVPLLGDLTGAYLLFPGGPLYPCTGSNLQAPSQLVVLDGTWRQVRRMLQRLPQVAALPRFSLGALLAPRARLRSAHTKEGRSTLEAIADAFEILDGPAAAQLLHAAHASYVERVMWARGGKAAAARLPIASSNPHDL